jgi:hypothetical protein
MAVKLGINPTLLSKYERGHRVVPTKIMDKAHRMLDDAGHRVELWACAHMVFIKSERSLAMPILNPIETLMEIRDLCDMEEQSVNNVDLELAREYDKLITIIQDLCKDTLTDIANELSGLIRKGQ